MFLQMILSIILKKKGHTKYCLILNGCRLAVVWMYKRGLELFGYAKLAPLYVCLWGWMKSEGNKMKLDTADELLAGILEAAGSIEKREDQLRGTASDLWIRVAKCVEVDGGILGTLIVNCNGFVISV
jgi:hypothetical protein